MLICSYNYFTYRKLYKIIQFKTSKHPPQTIVNNIPIYQQYWEQIISIFAGCKNCIT